MVYRCATARRDRYGTRSHRYFVQSALWGDSSRYMMSMSS